MDVQLSQEETEKLISFQQIIGNEDLEECKAILSRFDWDIQRAVNHSLGLTDEDNRNNLQGDAERLRDILELPDASSSVRVLPVMRQPVQRSWTQLLYQIVLLPFRFFYTTIYDMCAYLIGFIWPDPRLAITDPKGDVEAFLRKFDEKFAAPSEVRGSSGDGGGESSAGTGAPQQVAVARVVRPDFEPLAYRQALERAKQQLQFLLVYLHDWNCVASERFCRDVLCNDSVVELARIQPLICWGCDVNSPEGFRVGRSLRAADYPFIALIALRDRRMTIVDRLHGYHDSQRFVRWLEIGIQRNRSYLEGERLERHQQQQNRRLVQEQDQAYFDSLKADQEREQRQLELVRLEQERRDASERELRDRLQFRQMVKDLLPPEPADTQCSSDVIKLSFQLPNGTRLLRRFRVGDTLQDVYNWVFCDERAPDEFRLVRRAPPGWLPVTSACAGSGQGAAATPLGEFGLADRELLLIADADDDLS